MPLTNLLQEAKKYEIQSYEKPEKMKNLKQTHVPFSGSPQKHPNDHQKMILLTDPFSSNTSYCEFNIKDISYVEELPNIVDIDENTIIMVRIWVKKSSVGIRCSPFIVEDIAGRG